MASLVRETIGFQSRLILGARTSVGRALTIIGGICFAAWTLFSGVAFPVAALNGAGSSRYLFVFPFLSAFFIFCASTMLRQMRKPVRVAAAAIAAPLLALYLLLGIFRIEYR